ncbi:MAG: arginine--tRNA ligase [Candidatus Harrisonbacteria bacterium]|nr:arginine--tRNA ligase [Candidatus Harrisonbacteria bacterium]
MVENLEIQIKKVIGADTEFDISASEKEEFGHYSTNVAFKLAPLLKKPPFEIAKEIASSVKRQASSKFVKVEAVAPGFVNFWLKPKLFQKELAVILKNKNKYGRNNNLKGQKTIIEYTDPNPFKEFHIGHLMSNSIGEALSRIIEWNGAKVKRACYQGDVGMHVAKAVWGIDHLGFKKIDSMADLAKAYAAGSRVYESDERVKKEINEINKKIYDRNDKNINKIYDSGKALSLDHFENIYRRLGTKFNYYFFESETGKFGKKIVEKGLKRGVFEKSQGATVFKGEKYGLHTRVFINSEGLPTYEAKELGLAELKYKKYSYDKSIVITGNEVNDYFKVLLKVMEIMFPKLAERTTHLSHGMLRSPSGKMSSRTGDVITAESLIEDVQWLVRKKIKDRELSNEEKKEIEEAVSIAAIKYSILKQAVGGDIIFDFEKSISFEGDSGPYLQYAYTRANSVLTKAKEEGVRPSLKLLPAEVSEVERMLCRFPEILERAGKEYAPNYMVFYLTELARVFNSYYAKVKIVNPDDKYSPYKVALTEAFGVVLGSGLEILGMGKPKKM